MKKSIIILLCTVPLLLSAQKFSVSPFYTVSGGIMPSTWSTSNDQTFITADTSITYYSGESFNVSLGKGSRFGCKTEYRFKNLISLGASLSYFNSRDIPLKSTSEAEYDPYAIYNIKIATTDIYNNKAIDLGLYSHFLMNDKNTTPYLNAGIMLSFSKYTLNREVSIQNNFPGYYPTELYIYEYKISPSIHYGFTGSIGIEINRQKTISLFAETYCVLMNVSPTKRICKSKTWNSEDQFDAMTTSEKETVYVESYTDADNESTDEPTKALRFNQSFGSIGLQAGAKINF